MQHAQERLEGQHFELVARRRKGSPDHYASLERLDTTDEKFLVDRHFVCAHCFDAGRRAARVDVPFVPHMVGRHDACCRRENGNEKSSSSRDLHRVKHARQDSLETRRGRNDIVNPERNLHARLDCDLAQGPRVLDVDACT